MLDNPLVDEIYDKRPDNYKDIRHLYTVNAINRRLASIKTMISKIPQSKRVSSNKKYKNLYLESRLLLWKRAVYTTKDPVVCLTKWTLELTDKRYGNDGDQAALKREHTLPLLQMHMHDKTDDQLREILRLIDEGDLLANNTNAS